MLSLFIVIACLIFWIIVFILLGSYIAFKYEAAGNKLRDEHFLFAVWLSFAPIAILGLMTGCYIIDFLKGF